MISTDAVVALMLAANPNADVSAIQPALNQIAALTAATPSQPATTTNPEPTVPPADTQETIPESVKKPSSKPPLPTKTPSTTVPNPQIDPTEPLVVSPISVYKLPADREEGEEGYAGESTEEEDATAGDNVKVATEDIVGEDAEVSEKGQEDLKKTPAEEEVKDMETTEHTAEQPDLDEMAEKQGLMTEEEFEDLMRGTDIAEEVTADKQQQPEGVPFESAQDGEPTENQPIEIPSGTSVQEGMDRTQSEEPARSVKRRLILKGEPVEETAKIQRLSLKR